MSGFKEVIEIIRWMRKSRWPVVQMVAIYSGLCLVATYIYAGGIFYVELLDKYKEGEVKTNLVGTLNTASTSLFAPFAAFVSNRFSCRVSIVLGGMLCSLGLFLSAWQSGIIGIILCHGVISGIGNAMSGPAFTVVLGYYVQKHRHFFLSMTAPVIGIGMFVGTPLALFLIDKYGTSGTYMIFSGMVLHVCVLGSLCKPSEVEKELMQKRKISKNTFDGKNELTTIATQENNRDTEKASEFVKDEPDCVNEKHQNVSVKFCLFVIATFTWNFLLSIVQLHVPYYLTKTGHTNNFISIIMTCFSISNVVGRLLSACAVMKDNFDGFVVYFVSMIVAGIGTISFPWYSHLYAGPYMFSLIIGLMTGAPNGVMPSITIDTVGLGNLSTGYAVGSFFSGLGNLVGPILTSVLFDSSGTYFTTFIFSGCVVFVGSICSLIAMIPQRTCRRSLNAKPSV